MSDYAELLAKLAAAEREAELGGGKARLDRHHRLGRLGARERVAALCDAGSFFELERFVVQRHASAHQHPGDGLVCGVATVGAKKVIVYAHDPTIARGALGVMGSHKLCRALDLALEQQLPVLALVDCDGVRIDEGSDAVRAYGEVIARTVRLRGRVPQLTLVCGLCVGAAAYNAALTDLVGMVAGQSFMFITGPKVTQAVTGQDVSIDALGGHQLHSERTGSAHFVAANEADGIAWLKRVLAALDSAPAGDPVGRDTPEVQRLVPAAPRRAYDMKKVLRAVFDDGSLLELSLSFATSLLTFFARLGGRSVAVLASQPLHRAGCLDVDSSRKGAHFVRYANARGLPIVTLCDVPGYLPGQEQEAAGILAFGAELLSAYGEARVPTVSLVVRKSFGGANVLSYASRIRLALPTAAVAPMGAEAAADVAQVDPAAREQFIVEWREQHESVWAPARDGYFDKVIAPDAVRRELHAAIRALG